MAKLFADMTPREYVEYIHARTCEPLEAELSDTKVMIERTEVRIIRYAKLLAKLRAKRRKLTETISFINKGT